MLVYKLGNIELNNIKIIDAEIHMKNYDETLEVNYSYITNESGEDLLIDKTVVEKVEDYLWYYDLSGHVPEFF